MFKNISKGIFALALLVLPSLGNTAAINFTSADSNALFDATPWTLGWEFSVNTDISVTSLGQFDFAGDGLAGDAEIAIWETDGTLVTSTTIAAGTTGTLVDYFRYVDISPVLLSAGQSYIIGSYIAGEDALDLSFGSSVFSVDPAITALHDRYIEANSLEFPTQFDSPDELIGWFGPNFQFVARQADVPEPGMVALFGLSLVGFAALRRRKAA